MIGSNSWKDLITSNPENCRNYFIDNMSDYISFNNIDQFPEKLGIYFIYRSKRDVKEKTNPIYIGEAHKRGRDFKTRCRQYLQKGSGGNAVRKKLELIFNYSSEEAIKYIKNNFYCCFYITNKKKSICQIEQIAIWSFQPILNFLKSDFNFESLSF